MEKSEKIKMVPDFEEIVRRFDRRYRMKKIVNIHISAVILILGILSVAYIFRCDREGILTFRWLTVDGTIFTSAGAAVFIVVNLVELYGNTELTAASAYFIRLAAAVAESLIMLVVLLSQLPVFPEHIHMQIFRFDMFNMHLLIPVLTVTSFVLNDASVGRLRPLQRLRGTWFVTVYAAVIILLIQTGVVTGSRIPYIFLDFANMTWWQITGSFILVYGSGYLLSWGISELNRKLSWLWFRGIAERGC